MDATVTKTTLTKLQRQRVEALQKARVALAAHGPFTSSQVEAVAVVTVADWILDGTVYNHEDA